MYETVKVQLNDSCDGSEQQLSIHGPWVLILCENNDTLEEKYKSKKRFILSLGILLSKICFGYKLLLRAVSTASCDETSA